MTRYELKCTLDVNESVHWGTFVGPQDLFDKQAI